MVDIIIFAIIAAVIAYRLYNVLGAEDNNSEEVKGKVINLEPLKEEEEEQNITDNNDEHNLADQLIEDKLSKNNLSNLKKITELNGDFSISKFTKNSEKAFALIIEAFAAGKKDVLTKLCSKDIASEYEKEFQKQKNNGNKININLIGIESATIETISLKEKIASIKIKFVSEQISYVTDAKEEIVSGDKSKIEVIEDKWIFIKDLSSKSPIWVLSNTEN
jgi:predicted lipid-binding transport protein (Tim44 family)